MNFGGVWLEGFQEGKLVAPGSFLIRPTRFESPQIGQKIGRKTRSFAPYMFWTKLPLAPQQTYSFVSCLLSFSMLSHSFFPPFLFSFFQCCLSLTHFSFVLGAHLFLFTPVLFVCLFCFLFFIFFYIYYYNSFGFLNFLCYFLQKNRVHSYTIFFNKNITLLFIFL